MTSPTCNNILQVLKSFAVIALTLDIYFDVTFASSEDAGRDLEMGKQMLAAGNLVEALTHFDAAVDKDPSNYLTYFRRATVYLALGKSKSALPDLDKSIKLRPGFSAALLQRGNVYLKQGNLNKAAKDYEEVYNRDNNNADAFQSLQQIQPLEQHISEARIFYERKDYQSVIALLTPVIESCPWNAEFREMRAECYIAQGELFKAVGDIRPTTKLRNDNTQGYLKLSRLYYDMGDADESLMQVKECLRLDQDHKECFPHYKAVKKLVKALQSAQDASNAENWEDCNNKAKTILKLEPSVYPFVHTAKSHMCHCLAKSGNAAEGLKACNDLLKMDPESHNALCDRAEAYIANEQYEEAIRDFQEAINIDQDSRRAKEGVDRAQKLLKNSQKRDYYKILGVKRNAKKKQIIKAYRKLAVQWHPDKFQGDDKSHAEKMFMDIAAAKEVLSDPEKRAKFDQGEDPLDPEQQQQGGHHGGFPFGFNPFGGGGNQEKRAMFDQGEDPLDPEQQQGGHHGGFPFGFNPFGGGGNQGFNFKFHFN